ncbi:MAG: hypothetical protein MUF45_12050 [Spirosomaceae bacterium]|nr:hypothetical protein [Spirosomataceae bacterium]
MKNVSAFFDHRNTINSMSEAEEVQIFDYLKPVRAFARATNTSVYVIRNGIWVLSEVCP